MRIVQVAFLRRGERPALTSGDQEEIAPEVWEHFRDPGRIVELGPRTGFEVDIFDRPFDPQQRDVYVEAAVAFLYGWRPAGSQVVLLDPDTGLEPKSGPKPTHVKLREVRAFWTALREGDWLALYQHGPQIKTTGEQWRDGAIERFARTCGGAGGTPEVETFHAEEITKDVVLLAAQKGSP